MRNTIKQEQGAYQKIDEKAAKAEQLHRQIDALLKHPKLIAEHANIIQKYAQMQRGRTDIKLVSVYNIIAQLVPFLIEIPKPLQEITKEDIAQYFIDFKRAKKWSEATMAHRTIVIKQFFVWLYQELNIAYEGDFPAVVRALKSKKPDNKLKPSDLLSREEVRKMIEAMPGARDKAILAVLYDTGARAGELISVNTSDITHEKHSADIDVDGKTGKRSITIVESYPYLLQWLNQHPQKDNMNSPLFLNVSNGQFGRRLLYQGLVSTVRTAAKRAGLMKWGLIEDKSKAGNLAYKRVSGKKITPHLFRHSRVTELASKGWTEPELRLRFGWTSKSSTPSIYCHIGRNDIKEKLLREQGFNSKEVNAKDIRMKEALEPKICARCDNACTSESIACNKCGMALSIHDAQKIKELKQKTDDFENKVKELPLRSNLIETEMTPYEYKKKLIQKDPFLRDEFEKIAREVLKSVMLEKEVDEQKEKVSPKPITNTPVKDENKEAVISLRKKGWPMETISKELGLGYGTVNIICREEGLSKIY